MVIAMNFNGGDSGFSGYVIDVVMIMKEKESNDMEFF